MPTASLASSLIGVDQPLWLAALPLAALPLILYWLRPRRWVPAQAGWGLGAIANASRWKYHRLLLAAMHALSALLIILALAGPTWPNIAFLEPAPRGHTWAVVLDCSGSMATVDQGHSTSRLARLAAALGDSLARRPLDQFAIVRVAGFADRLGPATSNATFLKDLLKQLRPALPGEDGTSLGDGLILAAESLGGMENAAGNRSILLISDGRENRPDTSAKALAEVIPLLLKIKMRVDWLRVDLPGTENESPESRQRGEESRALLEELVRRSGGQVRSLGAGGDWPELTSAAVGPMPRVASDQPGFHSAACLSLILAFLLCAAALLANLMMVHGLFYGRAFLGLDFLILILLGIGLYEHFTKMAQNLAISNLPVKHRTLFLMDVSPSMAARDTADGYRLKSARRLARGMIQRLSLEGGSQAGVIAFSGRAVGLSPWTSDWRTLETILEELEPDRIAPTGSSWESALNVALEFYLKSDDSSGAINTDVVMITDGEASEEPAAESLERFKPLKTPVHTITLGTDRPPGMTFSTKPGSDRLWLDRSRSEPARSVRVDTLAQATSQAPGGRFFAVGTSRFDEFQIATGIFGKVAKVEYQKKPGNSHAREAVVGAFWIYLLGEIMKIIWRFFSRHAVVVLMACLVPSLSSCGPTGRDDISAGLDQAFQEYQAGKTIQAEAIVQDLRLKHPQEPVIEYNLALLKLNQGQPQVALELLREAVSLDDRNLADHEKRQLQSRMKAARGYAEIQNGDFQAAVQDLQMALSVADILPNNELKNIQANLQFALDQIKSAKPADVDQPEQSQPGGGSSNSTRFNNPAQELKTLAHQTRQRARTARERFEPAGDELLKPADPAQRNRRMDW